MMRHDLKIPVDAAWYITYLMVDRTEWPCASAVEEAGEVDAACRPGFCAPEPAPIQPEQRRWLCRRSADVTPHRNRHRRRTPWMKSPLARPHDPRRRAWKTR